MAKVNNVFRKLGRISNGLYHAIRLNVDMLLDKMRGRKTIAFNVNAATQLMHIEPVFLELQRRNSHQQYSFYILTRKAEMPIIKNRMDSLEYAPRIGSVQAARLLLFCDFFLSVDQGMVFPLRGCKIRACSFHGQPSKGNVFQRFNYRQINTLFFYGPLMRGNYLNHKKDNPHWPSIDCYDVGQPLSDPLFNQPPDKIAARNALGLDASRYTVIYAPSFEYCSSMATNGDEIINALLGLGINLIVKPHPAFYNADQFDDKFNKNIPNINEWRDKINKFKMHQNCVFEMDCASLDMATALSASDLMVTDFSGIAFDGIISDLKMIYWDCPTLYSEYLPEHYGVDGNKARDELASNVGREAGILVEDSEGLLAAIETYQQQPEYKSHERKTIREQLLFNPGQATKIMTDKIEQINGDFAND